MNEFIHEQIDSYHGKKYKKSDLKINDDKIFMVEIKNNKLIYNKNIKVCPAAPGRIPKIYTHNLLIDYHYFGTCIKNSLGSSRAPKNSSHSMTWLIQCSVNIAKNALWEYISPQ